MKTHQTPRARTLGWLAAVWLGLVPAAPLSAQEPAVRPTLKGKPEKAAPPSKTAVPRAGHSAHGEAFDEGPRQQAYLMGTTGKVHFAITTREPLAEKFFDQGLGQLHGFWYFEAERSFRQVAAIDPSCAMAYWGMAMANVENPARARGFIKKAVELRKNAGRREQLWIDGWAEYLNSARDSKTRKQDYIKSLENILYEFPDDIEARAFLVVRLWQFKSELPIVSHQAVDALLDQVFAANPLHPAHHYRIHLWDGVKPERALPSAAQLGPSAPGIAHQWHMAGHIYSDLKRYPDAAWSQEAAARVDHAHMIRDRVLPDQIHNYAHNQEWLVRDLSHIGQVRRAVDLARNLIELPRHPKFNTLQMRNHSAFFGRVRLFEVLERYELWDELIALCDTPYLEPTDLAEEQVRRLRALGVAHAGKGNREMLQRQIAELRTGSETAGSPEWAPARPARTPRPKADGDARPKPASAKPKAAPARTDTFPVQAVKDALNELGALDAQLAGDARAALGLSEKVRGMPRGRLALFHLAAGNQAKALDLAREAAESASHEVVPLANYVEVLQRCGKTKEAGEALARLRQISGQIDSLDVPPFRRLEPVAKALGLPADWRQPQAPARDLGERPPLDQLGPVHWHPGPAPNWALPAATDRTVSLADYRGRPVIVIFYLGHGCLHCVEQLNRLAPRARDFADAGISLVAVSSDSLEDLKQSQQAYEKGKEFPFPLVSDARLTTFKACRAFDDFEGQPLHATLLLDGNGLVRWQDVSCEPFTDVDFLLTEARRLLKLPGSAP